MDDIDPHEAIKMPSSRPSNSFQRVSQDDPDIRHDNAQVLSMDRDSNDESYDNSFSVFMLPTRNDSLDGLSRGHSMGSIPLDNTVRDTKLMFGLLAGKSRDRGGNSAQPLKARFRLETQVIPIQKGNPYY